MHDQKDVPVFVCVGNRVVPNVRHQHDPYKVRGTISRVPSEYWHLQCQPRVSPSQLLESRREFFSFYRV